MHAFFVVIIYIFIMLLYPHQNLCQSHSHSQDHHQLQGSKLSQKYIKVVLHFQKICWSFFLFHLHSWVEIRLHTNNQTPRLPGATQIPIVCDVLFIDYITNLGDFALG